MKALLILSVLLIPAAVRAEDPDLQYILDAVTQTPCSQVQVLIFKNIGVVRWSRLSMRYLYDSDIAPLRKAAVESGKRSIDLDREFKIPNLNDPDGAADEDALFAELVRIFEEDFKAHLPDGC